MHEYLICDGDFYLIGPRAELELGRSHWMALISVIHDSGGYLAVLPDGTVVGPLDARFVGSDPGKTFSFTGKTWRLLFRDDAHKRALGGACVLRWGGKAAVLERERNEGSRRDANGVQGGGKAACAGSHAASAAGSTAGDAGRTHPGAAG